MATATATKTPKAAARKAPPKAVKATVAPKTQPKPAKSPKAEKAALAPKPTGKRAEAMEAAQRGVMPAAPDFSAATHSAYRKRLASVVELVGADDVAGLEAFEIKVSGSTSKALDRYRNLAVVALKARSSEVI